MSQNLSTAAVVIGALRVKKVNSKRICDSCVPVNCIEIQIMGPSKMNTLTQGCHTGCSDLFLNFKEEVMKQITTRTHLVIDKVSKNCVTDIWVNLSYTSVYTLGIQVHFNPLYSDGFSHTYACNKDVIVHYLF